MLTFVCTICPQFPRQVSNITVWYMQWSFWAPLYVYDTTFQFCCLMQAWTHSIQHWCGAFDLLLDDLYTLSLARLHIHICCQERRLWSASRCTRLFVIPLLSSVSLLLQCAELLIHMSLNNSYKSSRCSFCCVDNCGLYWFNKDCSRETKARLLAMLSWWKAGILVFICV